LISFGESRIEAIQQLKTAIEQFEIEGVATTLPFGKFVLEHEAFISGDFDTHFVKRYFNPEKASPEEKREAEMVAALALKLYLEKSRQLQVPNANGTNWQQQRQ
ncbi:MAG: biotin carboxylase, partial [Bacteroidota bacterium]